MITFQSICEAARAHGDNSDPDHEIGDLQDYARAILRPELVALYPDPVAAALRRVVTWGEREKTIPPSEWGARLIARIDRCDFEWHDELSCYQNAIELLWEPLTPALRAVISTTDAFLEPIAREFEQALQEIEIPTLEHLAEVFGISGVHPDYPREEWHAAMKGRTDGSEGYLEWVRGRIESRLAEVRPEPISPEETVKRGRDWPLPTAEAMAAP